MASAVHISLNVSDLSKSVEFYRGFLGEPKKLKADYAKFVSADPEIHLALQPGLEEPDGGPALPSRHPRRVLGRGAPLAQRPQVARRRLRGGEARGLLLRRCRTSSG